jgi:hypothetical protein
LKEIQSGSVRAGREGAVTVRENTVPPLSKGEREEGSMLISVGAGSAGTGSTGGVFSQETSARAAAATSASMEWNLFIICVLDPGGRVSPLRNNDYLSETFSSM